MDTEYLHLHTVWSVSHLMWKLLHMSSDKNVHFGT